MHLKNTGILYFLNIIIMSSICFSCKENKQTVNTEFDNYAAFDWFNYKGNDSIYNTIEKSESEYLNPILAGFYPDPSICRVDNDYYLVTSSFTYFPGIPIFKSQDLVNWKQIGHVITRDDQADFSNFDISRGLFAPTIRYHNGVFYVICTNVSQGGNFIVTAKDPAGEWSEPIWIPEIDGIDPDLFFDEDGKVYIAHNGPPPNNITKHDGHRAIYIWEYDLDNQKIASSQKLLIDGGTDMAKKPVWIEAPHIIKKDSYYYLICAEGGTSTDHSEVVFRSKNIYGPYESFESNPILTQRHLSESLPNRITSTGHADFVETQNGDWWAVYLGCRPYEGNYYNTGRETFMLPVTWKDGWPIVENGNEPHPFVHKRPDLPLAPSSEKTVALSGNFEIQEDFDKDDLDLYWTFLRTPKGNWVTLKDGKLLLKPRTETIRDKASPSFIARRQQHLVFETSTKFTFTPINANQTAGLVAFQNDNHYIMIGKRLNKDGIAEVFVERASLKDNDGIPTILNTQILDKDSKDLFVKIEGKNRFYSFYYKTTEAENWNLLSENVDAVNLSTEEAQGFVGTMLAMYTSGHHFDVEE